MGFDAFSKQAGFDAYFGLDEYGNDSDSDGVWGIWDEEFFRFYCNQMSLMQEPFFTSIFSVTSHHPFKIPEKYKGNFPKGTIKIHESIGYTDYSLKRFFECAKTTGWFGNTIFVFTADHASTYSDFKKYKTSLGTFTVPFIIYEPGSGKVGFNQKRVVQQNDIMPTILNMIGYPKPFIAFGNNLFDEDTEHFAINYIGGSYQFIMDGYMIQFDGEKTTALYDINSDVLLKNNKVGLDLEVQYKLESELKAVIQQYNRRLIHNDMTVNY